MFLKHLTFIQVMWYDRATMNLNTKMSRGAIRIPFFFGIFLLILLIAGGIFVLQGQENKTSLTADISRITGSLSTEDNSEETIEVLEDTSVQPQSQTSPVLLASQKAWVSPNIVSAGGDITVTVDTSDISSFILFVDVYVESMGSGEIIKGSIVNIDGEGRKFGTLTIPSGAEQGEWILKRVSIVDASGDTTDYYDGQNITAIFTVTSL